MSAGKQMNRFLSLTGLNGFLGCIIAAIFLAWLWPAPGMMTKPVSLDSIANVGLSLVFFFYGLKLHPAALRKDLANWRMHLVVQASTFILFPLLLIAIKPLFNGNNTLLWLGSFYVAALPSTVSSSVVMVSIAGGNIPGAIFNASVSSLLGVFITPLWMALFLDDTGGSFDASGIILKLILQVLVPVMAGLLLNKYLGYLADTYKKQLRYFDQSVILLIIYSSFCHSFAEKIFSQYSALTLLLLGLAMAALFFLVFFILRFVNRIAGFSKADSITIVFCGSKKSLVHGTVMSKVLFSNESMAGILLLPLMMYHALQLVFVSFIAQKMAGQPVKEALPPDKQ
ncbi:MAG: bile acid:sodium symporter family protein [Ferruginibacter sp.]